MLRVNFPTSTGRIQPVQVFAALGVLAVIVPAMLLVPWWSAGNFHTVPVPPGVSISTTRIVLLRVEEVLMAVGTFGATIYLIYDCRRRRKVTLWAIPVWANWFTWWLDPIMPAVQFSPTPNRFALHVVGWGPVFPGWNNPHPEWAVETIFAAQCLMYPMIVIWVWAQWRMITPIMRRFPHWRAGRILPLIILTGVISDIIIEAAFILCGAYGYPRALQDLSLFGGHWYQVPLFNSIVGGMLMASPYTFLLWAARRTNSTVWLFRGSEHLTPGPQATLRILAGIGYANLIILCYVLLVACIPLLGTDPVPADTPGWIWPYH